MADVKSALTHLQQHARQTHYYAEQAIRRELDQRVNVDTGALRKNQLVTSRASATEISSTISYTLPQAVFTDKGTRAHGPRHAKFLVFTGKSGKVVFTKHVRGIKAYRWFSNTMKLSNWRAKLIAGLARAR